MSAVSEYGRVNEQPTRTKRALTSYPARILLGLAIIAGMVLVVKASNARPTPTAAIEGAAGAPSAAPGQIGDGVWVVGADVQPGTYRSTGPASRYCMWSRHNTLAGGPMDGIIASDGSSAGGVLVTIQPTDKVFRTRGCVPFQRVS